MSAGIGDPCSVQDPHSAASSHALVSVDLADPQDYGHDKTAGQSPGWLSLYSFTTAKHVPWLALAVVFSILCGVIAPGLAILIGDIFNIMAAFGAGSLKESNFKDQISRYCLYLVTLGIVTWIADMALFVCWRVFGDLQAKCCRDQVFEGFLLRDLTWYDLQKNGIGTLVSRTQRRVLRL